MLRIRSVQYTSGHIDHIACFLDRFNLYVHACICNLHGPLTVDLFVAQASVLFAAATVSSFARPCLFDL